MSWVDVFSAVVAGLALWTLLGLALALVLGPLLARRVAQQATRSMLGPMIGRTVNFPYAATREPLDVVATGDDLTAAGLVAEDK